MEWSFFFLLGYCCICLSAGHLFACLFAAASGLRLDGWSKSIGVLAEPLVGDWLLRRNLSNSMLRVAVVCYLLILVMWSLLYPRNTQEWRGISSQPKHYFLELAIDITTASPPTTCASRSNTLREEERFSVKQACCFFWLAFWLCCSSHPYYPAYVLI